MAQLASKISGSFVSKPTGDAEATERYLELTRKCMERTQKMTSRSDPTSPKFNFEQCKYLADKLKLAFDSAHLFFMLLSRGYFFFASSEDTANCLEIFQLLYALGKEVENFIQSCCKDAWMQAAVTLSNVLEHVSEVGFNLELWIVVFSKSKELRARRSLTLTEVDRVFRAEVESVKEKASLDREMLLRNLNAVLQTRKPTNTEYQLAVLLIERLNRPRKVLAGDSLRSSQLSLSATISRSLKQMESLGKGSFATVYRAKWLGAEVAKKTFYGPNFPDFEKEVSILARLSHPKIASLLGYAKDKRECAILMELMDEDLFSLIQRRFQSTREYPFGILEGVDIMLQIGEGMYYLHGMRIVHRDLKSSNILVKCAKSTDLEAEYVVAKVADFGMSRTKERSVTYSSQTLNIGTSRWMAPEMIKSCNAESQAEKFDGDTTVVNYPFKSDIYSFAMVCCEILTGDTPFASTYSLSDVKKMVLNGVRPPLPYECPPLLKNLITRCWSPDASIRPSFADICSELRHLKFLFLMPSGLRNISPALSKLVPPSARHDTVEVITKSIPIEFKRDNHGTQWLVGLDIGTTESGFAYAKGSHLHQMHVNYGYPYAEKPFYKALTALYYNLTGPATIPYCASWGHLAQMYHHQDNVHSTQQGFYVPHFKLLLLKGLNNYHPSRALGLPYPLTVKSLITDYLKHIGELALKEINNCEGERSINRDSVQWCVTVPSIWDDYAKQQMKECMVNAGLLSTDGGTDSDVVVFLKSQAGSILMSPATFTVLGSEG